MKVVKNILKCYQIKINPMKKETLTFVSVISDFIEQKKKELGDLTEKGKEDRRRNQSI